MTSQVTFPYQSSSTLLKPLETISDPWDYILTDQQAEDKWQFSLKESLKRGKDKKLLADYTFNIQVTSAADVLKGV